MRFDGVLICCLFLKMLRKTIEQEPASFPSPPTPDEKPHVMLKVSERSKVDHSFFTYLKMRDITRGKKSYFFF